MRNTRTKMNVTIDYYTRCCLTAIAVLLTITVVGLWADGVPGAPAARAAETFGDSGGQRELANDLLKQTNAKLDELISLLKSGEARIQLATPGGEKGGSSNAPKNAKN